MDHDKQIGRLGFERFIDFIQNTHRRRWSRLHKFNDINKMGVTQLLTMGT
jgi:hypothetical protein